MYTKCSRFRSL